MPISEAEQVAAQNLSERVKIIKVKAFDMFRSYLRMDDEGLKHSGHKTVSDALVYSFKAAEKEINALEQEFLKKFPDK